MIATPAIVSLLHGAQLPQSFTAIRLTETIGHGVFRQCDTSMFLSNENNIYMVVNCQIAADDSRPIYRLIPLSLADALQYLQMVAEADLFGGGYVAELGPLTGLDSLQARLTVVMGGRLAVLVVTDNPTFAKGARARLLQVLQSTRERVFWEEVKKSARPQR